jgi:hypothetical protein
MQEAVPLLNFSVVVLIVVFYPRCDASEKARVVRGASSESRNASFRPPPGSESSRDNPSRIGERKEPLLVELLD